MSSRKGKKFGEGSKLSSSTVNLISPGRRTEGGNDINELETLFTDMMLCSLCGEVFRDPLRLPKALPCTHTYCIACLNTCLKDAIVECPDCDGRYDVRGNVNLLPNSAMVMRVLDKVCKLCHTMAKLEECSHCKRVSCGVCLKSHLADIRDEMYTCIREISTATENLSSKQNLIDSALADVNEKASRVKSEVAYQTDQLVEMVTQRHEKVMDQIEKEVTKERKRLNNIKKALIDTQDTNLSLCSTLEEELDQSVLVLAARYSSMKNNCAVQMDKIKREQAAMLSLEWDLGLNKPDSTYIKKELDELLAFKVIPKSPPKVFGPASPKVGRVRMASSGQATSMSGSGRGRNHSFAEGNQSFAKVNNPGKSRSESAF